MPRGSVILIAAMACLGAQAQPVADRPVDQAVEDLDPRAASLRVVDPGNAQFPTRSMIVQRAHAARWQPGADLADHRYEYRAPGVRAVMNRPDYVVLDGAGRRAANIAPAIDGAFLETAPPDTVFRLTPDQRPIADPATTDPRPDARIDARVRYPVRLTEPDATAVPPDTAGRRYIIRRLHGKRYADSADADAEAQVEPSPATAGTTDGEQAGQQERPDASPPSPAVAD